MVEISIIIPVYNGEKYIGRCLESIMSEPIRELEIIVVNDNSNDNTIEILEQYKALDERLIVINKHNNEGPMVARKDGIKLSSGKYCAFCDCDDWIATGSLGLMYEIAIKNSADIILGDISLINSSNKTFRIQRAMFAQKGAFELLKAIYSGVICSLCGGIFRTEYIKGINFDIFKNLKMSEDRIILTEILLNNPKVLGFNEVTYFYYSNENSSTRTRLTNEVFISQINALKFCLNLLCKEKVLENIRNGWFIKYLIYYVEQGYALFEIFSKDKEINKVLRYRNILAECGFISAFHLYGCKYSKLYRFLAQTGRKQIRKIQNKI